MTVKDLPTRKLGRTGFEATVLGFGSMELRGATGSNPRSHAVEPSQSERILNLVLDSGINYVDTSIDYGQSEESIGRFIAHRRDEYFLASKCGCWVGDPPSGLAAGQRLPHVFTRDNIVAGVEQSLRRLQTDHLDLVQFHASPAKETLEKEGALETLLDLQRQGKVRFIGSSSTLPHLVDLIDLGVFDVFQVPYSALERKHARAITAAAESGAGTVIRGGYVTASLGGAGVLPGPPHPNALKVYLNWLLSPQGQISAAKFAGVGTRRIDVSATDEGVDPSYTLQPGVQYNLTYRVEFKQTVAAMQAFVEPLLSS